MKRDASRRQFWVKLGGVPLAAALGGSLPAKGAVESRPKHFQRKRSMLEGYFTRFGEILKEFETDELTMITRAAEEAVRCLERGGKLYCGLLGHLFYKNGGEIAPGRVGNPALFTLDTNAAGEGDFLLVMSPTEAKKAKDKGVFCVGFTSPYFLHEETPPLALAENPAEVLRNPDQRMLSDICDITIRCHTPYTEGIMESPAISTPVIPATSQITAILYWSLAGEITARLARKGVFPKVAGEST